MPPIILVVDDDPSVRRVLVDTLSESGYTVEEGLPAPAAPPRARALHAATADTLTQELIEDGMARAEEVACRPGDDRCSVFPDPLANVRASCTPKGRCRLGWIVANCGRDSWGVWLDVHTGEGRLRRRRD